MSTGKLFWNGRSQAVRLPKEFRFEGDAVHVRRDGPRVVLEAIRGRAWPRGYWSRLGRVSADFEAPARLDGGRALPDLDGD